MQTNTGYTPSEEREFAKERKEAWLQQFFYGWKRENQMADEFNKLLIEITSIMFALAAGLSPLIVGKLTLLTEYTFVIGLGCLTISLFFGLLNPSIKQAFWHRANSIYSKGIDKLDQARRGDIPLKEAEAYCSGITAGENNIQSPSYAWKLQLAFSLAGVVFLFFSFANFIL